MNIYFCVVDCKELGRKYAPGSWCYITCVVCYVIVNNDSCGVHSRPHHTLCFLLTVVHAIGHIREWLWQIIQHPFKVEVPRNRDLSSGIFNLFTCTITWGVTMYMIVQCLFWEISLVYPRDKLVYIVLSISQLPHLSLFLTVLALI